jgi:hypothetical protein
MHKELPPKIKAVAEYYIQNPSLQIKQIAKQFNVTDSRISQILRHPGVTKAYPILARRIMMTKMLPDAVEAYGQLVKQQKNLQVQEKAAGTILKQAGVFDAPDVTVRHEIGTRPIAELKAIVEQSKAVPEGVIEAEVVEDKEQDKPE